MSDAAENIDDVVVDDHQSENQEQERSETQPKPVKAGYLSKEEWIAEGRDPKEWITEDAHRERGQRIKETKRLEREFENRIRNLNLLHEMQLKTQRDELLSKRDDAIDIADKAAVKAIDKQLATLDEMEALTKDQPVAQEKPQAVVEWEAKNPWVYDDKDPRTAVANKSFIAAVNAGMDPEDALELVEATLAKKFSTRQPSRQMVEGSRPSSGKRDAEVPTMANLTTEEKKIWDNCSSMFGSEKEFLKSVADARKGAKK